MMYEEDAISLGDDEPIAHELFADDEFDEINTMVLDHYNATSMVMDAEASLFRQVPSARVLIDTLLRLSIFSVLCCLAAARR